MLHNCEEIKSDRVLLLFDIWTKEGNKKSENNVGMKVSDLVNCTLAAHIFLLTKVYREWKINVIISCILFFTVQGR